MFRGRERERERVSSQTEDSSGPKKRHETSQAHLWYSLSVCLRLEPFIFDLDFFTNLKWLCFLLSVSSFREPQVGGRSSRTPLLRRRRRRGAGDGGVREEELRQQCLRVQHRHRFPFRAAKVFVFLLSFFDFVLLFFLGVEGWAVACDRCRSLLLRDVYDDMLLDGVKPTRDTFLSLIVAAFKGSLINFELSENSCRCYCQLPLLLP